MKYCQLVVGPAGSGKSSYCTLMQQHCAAKKRAVHIANLDPAAEHFEYEPTFDIRDLITVDDAMECLGLGPNGALMHCMEYLIQNADWIESALCGGDPSMEVSEGDYLLLDFPGQIELYLGSDVMRHLVEQLTQFGYRCATVFIVDSTILGTWPSAPYQDATAPSKRNHHDDRASSSGSEDEDEHEDENDFENQGQEEGEVEEENEVGNDIFLSEKRPSQSDNTFGDFSKFISANFICLAAMMSIELPHFNVISKCDLLPPGKRKILRHHFHEWDEVEHRIIPDRDRMLSFLDRQFGPKFSNLNRTIDTLVNADYNMTSFVPLDPADEDSIEYLLSAIDMAIQFGEDEEPQDPAEEDENAMAATYGAALDVQDDGYE